MGLLASPSRQAGGCCVAAVRDRLATARSTALQYLCANKNSTGRLSCCMRRRRGRDDRTDDHDRPFAGYRSWQGGYLLVGVCNCHGGVIPGHALQWRIKNTKGMTPAGTSAPAAPRCSFGVWLAVWCSSVHGVEVPVATGPTAVHESPHADRPPGAGPGSAVLGQA